MAYIAELRATVGLSADRDHIRRIYADPAAVAAVASSLPSEFADLVVEPDEVKAMRSRNVVQDAAFRLDPALRAALGVKYQTLKLDSSLGADQTMIEVLTSATADEVRIAVERDPELAPVLPSIRLRAAAKTSERYQQLVRGMAETVGQRPEAAWERYGALAQIHIDLDRELVVASLDTEHPKYAEFGARLRSVFASTDVEVVDFSMPQPLGNPTCANGNHKCDWNWVYGGLNIGFTGMPNGGTGVCTSNISVRYGPDLPAQVTAGHCLPGVDQGGWNTGRAFQGSNYFTTTPPAGDEIGNYVARATILGGANSHSTQLVYDAGLYNNNAAATRPGIGRVHIRDNQSAQVLSGVAVQVQGSTVCTSGMVSTGMDGKRYEMFISPSPTRCGTVDQIGTALDQYGQAWPRFTRTTVASQAGDSGGVIYSGGGPVYAVGIVSSVDVPPPFSHANKCYNGSTWVSHYVNAYHTMPCRFTYTSPLSTLMVVWGLSFQSG